jgi:hypothetical protein
VEENQTTRGGKCFPAVFGYHWIRSLFGFLGQPTHTDEKEGHRKVALFPFYQAALFVVMACLSILYAEMFDRIQWNGYITPLWLNEGVAKRAERGRKRLQCSGVPLLPEL